MLVSELDRILERDSMAFKTNYRQQRAERDRQARAKQAEKLKKLHDNSERRKAEREKTDLDDPE